MYTCTWFHFDFVRCRCIVFLFSLPKRGSMIDKTRTGLRPAASGRFTAQLPCAPVSSADVFCVAARARLTAQAIGRAVCSLGDRDEEETFTAIVVTDTGTVSLFQSRVGNICNSAIRRRGRARDKWRFFNIIFV